MAQSIVGAIQLIKNEQEKIINRFGGMSKYLEQIIKSGKDIKERNKIALKQAQEKVWCSFFFFLLLVLINMLFMFW